jgi:oxalate decarboxylase/phosphoglucose isomerase-like protein (cupin superfamily)
LKAWDFVHCPPWTDHVFVGAGDGPCAILAVGSRASQDIVYPVSEVAARHGASVETETPNAKEAYAPFGRSAEAPYRGQLDAAVRT